MQLGDSGPEILFPHRQGDGLESVTPDDEGDHLVRGDEVGKEGRVNVELALDLQKRQGRDTHERG